MSTTMHSIAEHYTSSEQFASIAWATKRRGVLDEHGDLTAPSFRISERVAKSSNVDLDPSIYRIYSMTKPIIAVSAYLMSKAGKLNLDDPIDKYLPKAAQQKVLCKDGTLITRQNTATIEQLLTHRAGLSYDFLPDCPVATLYREADLADNGQRSLADLCDTLCTFPLADQPGKRWQYSYASDIIAHILELVSSTPLDELLATMLFEPLGMHDTAFHVQHDQRYRLKTMFGSRHLSEVMTQASTPQKLTKLDVDKAYPIDSTNGFRRGGIGLYSTLSDYLAFAELLRTGITSAGDSLLNSTALEELWSNRLPTHQRPIAIGPNHYAGYGWNLFGRVMVDVDKAEGQPVPGEGGWAGAASTYFWVDRQHQRSGVVLTQYLGSSLTLGPQMQVASYSSKSS